MPRQTPIDTLYRQDEITSVVSAPKRCPAWGDASYRGNCDGTLFKNLVLLYKAKRVADPMMGSGTTRDVIQGLNATGKHSIHFWGSDLNEGFDLHTSLLPGTFDFVFVHPPYWNLIKYSNDPRDLSTLRKYNDDFIATRDFVYRLERCLRNCFESVEEGGRLAVLVGDVRRSGVYTPIIRDVLNWEPRLGKLRSIIIKTQHNCTSDRKKYPKLQDPRIAHEYCVIFQKESDS